MHFQISVYKPYLIIFIKNESSCNVAQIQIVNKNTIKQTNKKNGSIQLFILVVSGEDQYKMSDINSYQILSLAFFPVSHIIFTQIKLMRLCIEKYISVY